MNEVLTKEEKSELREKINGHPLLDLPPDERDEYLRANEKLYTEFCELILHYKAFDQILSANGASSYLLQSEEDYKKALYSPKQRTMYFDGLAFSQAIKKALKNYNKNKAGSALFLTYFDTVYRNQLGEECKKVVRESLPRLSQHGCLLLGDIQRYSSQYMAKGSAEIDLTDEQCREIAKMLGIKKWEKVRELLQAAKLCRTVSLDKMPENGGYSGPAEDGPWDEISLDEKVDLATFFNILCCDPALQEYIRLFLSNWLLEPLHKKKSLGDEEEAYARSLFDYEKSLYQNVFEMEYLYFVGWAYPEIEYNLKRLCETAGITPALGQIQETLDPQKLGVLCYAVPMRQLEDQTIGAFKKKSDTSYRKKQVKAFLIKVYGLLYKEKKQPDEIRAELQKERFQKGRTQKMG